MTLSPNMTTESQKQVVEQLNELIALDYDAIAAYDAAVERIDDERFRTQLVDFRSDHERHIAELAECVTMLGGKAREKGDLKKILTTGKIVIANLAGDNALLKAMRSNEDETNAKYEKALEDCRTAVPDRIRTVLQRGLADERRHRSWLIQAIGN